jgi:hypothetical protein
MSLNIGHANWAGYYNYQEIEGIENVEVTVDEETVDLSTIKGQKITFPKNHSAEIAITLIDTGIDNLKKIIPDAALDNGELIPGQPAGNVVNNSDGAVAVGYTGSTEATLQKPLQLIPDTGAGDHTITLFDGVATLTDLTLEDQVVRAVVTVRSEASGVQIVKGKVTLVS